MSVTAYEQLVERGCLCGTDEIHACPVHKDRGDLRGIAAFFKAGMPHGFPMEGMNCGQCRVIAQRLKVEATEYAQEIADRHSVDSAAELWELLTADERSNLERYAEAEEVLNRADMLGYPNAPAERPNLFPELQDPDDHQAVWLRKTCICPRCSTPDQERRLREECERAGYLLKTVSVFEGVSAS